MAVSLSPGSPSLADVAGASSTTDPGPRPNIVVILVDDMGFSDLSCYGGEIPTPNLDALAAAGLRFSQAYNCGRCCPTRASLLTGLYPHQAGVGHMTKDDGLPGYRGRLGEACPTSAEALGAAGYFTVLSGKWHVGQNQGVTPWTRGFQRNLSPSAGGFYFASSPMFEMWLGSEQLTADDPRLPDDWYSTDLWTTFGLECVDQARAAGKPFFLYLAHNAPHFPLQAPADAIDAFRGRYREGWDALAHRRAERQRELGLLGPDQRRATRPDTVAAWDTLRPEEQDRFDHLMAVYAATVHRMDRAVGDLVAGLRDRGMLDDTLILFLSDNGGNAESGPAGRTVGDPTRADSSWFCGESWAHLQNVPFRRSKHFAHEGGVATPLIAHWPRGIAARGEWRHQPAHVIDIMPTCLAVAAAAPLETRDDRPAPPLEGVSLVPAFGDQPLDRDTIFWEHEGNAAIRERDLKLVRLWDDGPWELYDLAADRTEQHDLAGARPEDVRRLADRWEAWARRVHAVPRPEGQPVYRSRVDRAAPRPGVAGLPRANVLLLLVDDLKPALGCYGDTLARTPCIDALAARGVRFDRAYCNQAVCAPSRYALLLGSRPTSSGLYFLASSLRERLPDAVTLPQYFRRHGWRSESLGKVFHIGHGNCGDAESFDVPPLHDLVIEYVDPARSFPPGATREEALFANVASAEARRMPRGPAFEMPDVADDAYADGRVAGEAIRRLREAGARRASLGTPFFLAVGFARPHLPFSVPRRYWDLHDPDTLPRPSIELPPAGSPKVAGNQGGEIAAYEPVPLDGAVTADLARRLVHGYYAAVSYVDAQVGRVVGELDRLGLADETLVVLWGDHGYHLGDHGWWTKHTNYEQATRIPLIVVAPGIAVPGGACQQPVESVDLYPTLAELAGLPFPSGPQPVDGLSLVPLLRDPTAGLSRDFASHCFPRDGWLGRSIRTRRHRLVEWSNNGAAVEPEWELYDYHEHPEESRNLAAERPELVRELASRLQAMPTPRPLFTEVRAPAPAEGAGHCGKAAVLLNVSPNTMTRLIADACPELKSPRGRRPR